MTRPLGILPHSFQPQQGLEQVLLLAVPALQLLLDSWALVVPLLWLQHWCLSQDFSELVPLLSRVSDRLASCRQYQLETPSRAQTCAVGLGAKVALDFQLHPFEQETALGLPVEDQVNPAPDFAVPDASPVAMGHGPKEAGHRRSSRLVARLALEAGCESWSPSPGWAAVAMQAAKN